MKHRRSLTPLATLAAALSLIACHESGLLGVDAPAPVRRFLGSQPTGQLRGYDAVLMDRAANLVVFRVTYGEATGCTTGCQYPVASGLAVSDRVGWLDGPALTGGAAFDVAPADTAIFGKSFQDAFLPRLRQADAAAWNALLLRLASDRDTPPATLLAIASLLHDGTGLPAVGEALLANPTAGSSFDVLSALAQIDTWIRPPWYGVTDTAWARLRGKVPPVSTLRATGHIRRANDQLYPGAVAVNTASAATLVKYPPFCEPNLKLYRDSTLTGPATWDAQRWWPGLGCKLPWGIRFLAPGDSVDLTLPGFRPADVLGDSLPAGRYWAVVPIQGVQTPSGAAPAAVPAGPVDLAK